MRTRSPSCGIVASHERSPSPVVAAKSSRDMEAAFAIAELSAGVSVSTPSSDTELDITPASASPETTPMSPDSRDGSEDGKTENCENTDQKRSVAPKFSHVKSAVMPTTHSCVQKALKRKLEGRTAELCAGQLQDQVEAVEKIEFMKRAIEKERDNFLTIKRFRPNTVVEVSSGRFVRTCQPTSRTADETVESKRTELRNPVLGVDFHMTPSKQAANISYGDRYASSIVTSEKDIINYGDCQPAFLSRHTDQISLKQMSEDIDRLKTNRDFLQSDTVRRCERTSFVPRNSHAAVSVGHPSTPVVTSRFVNISPSHKRESGSDAVLESNNSVPVVRQKPVVSQHFARSRQHPRVFHGSADSHEVSLDPLDKLKSFYNVGLSDAVSHYFFPQLVSESTSPRKALPTTATPVSSRFVPLAVVPGWHRADGTREGRSARNNSSNGSQNNVNAMKIGGRVVDSSTEMKVKKGDFGSLRVLRDYYQQLGSRKLHEQGQLCKSASPTFMQNEPTVSNRWLCVNRSNSAEELAVDLSLPKRDHLSFSGDGGCASHTSDSSAENQAEQSRLWQSDHELDRELFRPSKSCGSSPTPRQEVNDCLKNELTKTDLPKKKKVPTATLR